MNAELPYGANQQESVADSEIIEKRRIRDAIVDALVEEHARLHGDKEYHGPWHPVHVANEVMTLCDTAGYSEMDPRRLALYLSAFGHDLGMNSVEDPQTGRAVRMAGVDPSQIPNARPGGINIAETIFTKRTFPEKFEVSDGNQKYGLNVFAGNEQLSIYKTLAIVRSIDKERLVVTPEVEKLIESDVAVTWPSFSMTEIPRDECLVADPKTNEQVDFTDVLPKNAEGRPFGLLIDAPNLTKPEVTKDQIFMTLGDLGTFGRLEVNRALVEGNAELRESYPRLKRVLQDRSIFEMEPSARAQFAKDAIGWIQMQIAVALHQKMRVEKLFFHPALMNDPEFGHDKYLEVRERYSHFVPDLFYHRERYLRVKEMYGFLTDPKAFEGAGGSHSNEILSKLLEDELRPTMDMPFDIEHP